jgi:predicted amidophosphoribosyltransferase
MAMQVNLRPLTGHFDSGYALDKHSKYSTPIGYNEYGHMQFETVRTEAGEATFQLKYRQDHSQVAHLAEAVRDHIVPLLPKFGMIIPMPASNVRTVQPVYQVAEALGKLLDKPVFENMLIKAPGGPSLKNLNTREEKVAALAGQITLNPVIQNNGKWAALVVDDLYHSGASLDAACDVLRTYEKIGSIYVATLTWR